MLIPLEKTQNVWSASQLLETLANDTDSEVAQKTQEPIKVTNVLAHPGAHGHKGAQKSA